MQAGQQYKCIAQISSNPLHEAQLRANGHCALKYSCSYA